MVLRPAILLFILLIVVASVPDSSAGPIEAQLGLAHFANDNDNHLESQYVGDIIEEDEEMEMDSEISRRGLAAQRGRYISYGALSRNRVPCNRRGRSYYNCQPRGRANPYRRGCSVITRCARFLK